MRKLLLLLLLLASPLWAQERLQTEMVTISPSFWYKNDVGVTVDGSQLASNVTDASGGAGVFTAAGATRPQLTRADNLENFFLQSDNLAVTWTPLNVGIAGSQADPFGGTTAFNLTPDGTNAEHRVQQVITQTPSTQRYSLYWKPNTYSICMTLQSEWQIIFLNDGSNLPPSTYASTPTPSTVSAGGGWFLTTVTWTSSAAAIGTGRALRIQVGDGIGNVSFAGDGSHYVTVVRPLNNGAAADATYVSTTTYPQFRGGAGYKGLRFDGVANEMQGNSVLATTTGTIFIVWRPAATNITTYNTQLLYDSNSDFRVNFANFSVYIADWTTGGAGDQLVMANQMGAGINIFRFRYNPSAGRARVNAGAVVEDTSLAGTVRTLDNAWLGTNKAALHLWATIFELITFDSYLPDDQEAAIYRYLSFKYGV